MSEIVNTVPFIILTKNKITYKNLTSKFPKSSSFVLQGCESSGGSKTIYIDKNNIGNIVKYLSNDESYSISPYVDKNISINVHIIIYEEEIVFFRHQFKLFRIVTIIYHIWEMTFYLIICLIKQYKIRYISHH